MIIVVPLATGQQIYPEVKESIFAQGIDCVVVQQDSIGEVKSQRVYTPHRIKGESNSREKCRIWVQHNVCPTQYIVMQDRDRLHTRNDNFHKMREFLNENAEYGAISCSGVRSIDKEHIDIGCAMYRYDVFIGLNFINKYGRCLCREVTEQINMTDFKFDYLDGILRTKEINYEIL